MAKKEQPADYRYLGEDHYQENAMRLVFERTSDKRIVILEGVDFKAHSIVQRGSGLPPAIQERLRR